MKKKLAIKGHATRGKEVIELLEMLDGHNGSNLLGNESSYVYFITDSGEIGCRDINHVFIDYFTLEEFLEKYPYKVGDKVIIHNCSYLQLIIGMKWEGTIKYLVSDDSNIMWWFTAEELKDFNTIKGLESTGFMQLGKTCGIIFNEANYEKEVELQLGDYEIEIRDGKTYAVLKKPKYPTTYEECCKITEDVADASLTCFACNLLNDFQKLLLCRDAYWEIAGEQMGLDGLWEPDWTTSGQDRYTIETNYNKFIFSKTQYGHRVLLVFPTEEMRDAFYENFKELLEACKELL